MCAVLCRSGDGGCCHLMFADFTVEAQYTTSFANHGISNRKPAFAKCGGAIHVQRLPPKPRYDRDALPRSLTGTDG